MASPNSSNSTSHRPWVLPATLLVITSVLIAAGLIYKSRLGSQSPLEVQPLASPSGFASAAPFPSGLPSPGVSASPVASLSGQPVALDLNVDSQGLSKSTVVMKTDEGVIKFKFYPKDAPNTVNRIAELVQKGFYNGLTFHRVVPGFVIQGGDPTGTGAGGSGQKLKAEFSARKHTEGTVAMARTQDPDSADSQFYISFGPQPHLDQKYTIFGQVIEGMDVAKKIKKSDRIVSMTIINE